ncbi:cytochrome P450 93A3-like [Arachis ipaensis]|nr:cytochrome P450 93A3-like [Arachis ipaensis]XP_025663621.1 cytochrome P450 93A3-like isoform X1 [Arachis hypogaea]QHN84421.1 3,9-dihydroxypterocarpan 6A-monooxygenase [Arachis hypogaea]
MITYIHNFKKRKFHKMAGDYDYKDYIQLFMIWLISTIIVRAIFNRKKNKSHNKPPSPLSLPIIGHLHLLAPIPHQALHKLSIRYGPIMHIKLGSVPCVVASTPESAKEFLKTHESSFSNRPRNLAVDYLTYGSQDFSFAPYGPYWKFMKKICMSELLGGDTLNQLLPLRRQETERFLGLLLKRGMAGEAVDVGGELLKLSNNVISRMIMSKTHMEDDGEAEEVRKLVQDTAELTGKFNASDFIWFLKNWDLQGFRKRVEEIRNRFDSMMERVIKEHQGERMKRKKEGEDGEIKDLLDILLDIHEDDNSEIRLTKENIKAFILDIFIAGTDTSALTIEWGLAELINHPQVMERARQEIKTVVGNNRIVEESDIVNLPYLQAIVKETLRIHPTGPMTVRESSEDCTIWGYEIPAKTQLFVNIWAIGRDPNYWENPLEFKPERFLVEEESGKRQLDVRGQHLHMIPFGSGRRGCPGTSLALQVVQANLGAMVQCFEWKVSGGGSEIVDMEEKPGLTLSRACPLICVPLPRLSPFPSM